MSVYLTNTTDLTSVADAIRTKGGTSAVLVYPSEFISAIQAIQTVGTYQSKVVSPTESQQIVNPDSGYDALSSVTVNAISSTYIGTGIAQKAAATYTPTTTVQSIASGQYLIGVQTIAGDSNLVAANIASGITIFGVTGTHQSGLIIDDIVVVDDFGLCFNNFSMSSNTCISEAGTVSGNTLIAV